MNIVNLSAEPLGRLHSWLPHDLHAERVVFLPDACPGKSPLPTGTVVHTSQPDWRKFAVSDCGCGMRLLRTQRYRAELSQHDWDAVAERLKRNAGALGELGQGNHFLDALAPASGGPLHILIHTGSRAESGHVDTLIDNPPAFDAEFSRVTNWARQNRFAVQEAAEAILGPMQLILDVPHNTFEPRPDFSVIIRKGAVHVRPGDLAVLPSHMAGDVALVRATEQVSTIFDSLSHGTGRAMSRADAKELARDYDFAELRSRVMMPRTLNDATLRTEAPFAYRDLDECLLLLDGYVEVLERFEVVAYMGHL